MGLLEPFGRLGHLCRLEVNNIRIVSTTGVVVFPCWRSLWTTSQFALAQSPFCRSLFSYLTDTNLYTSKTSTESINVYSFINECGNYVSLVLEKNSNSNQENYGCTLQFLVLVVPIIEPTQRNCMVPFKTALESFSTDSVGCLGGLYVDNGERRS